MTISHLRFGDKPIKSPYYINKADFVACHNPSYITKGFKIVNDVKPGGVFLINCQWDLAELEHHLNAEAKRYIAKNNIQLYTINAIDLAITVGMGKRTNTILQSAFFSLAKVMPEADAIKYMKDAAEHSYAKKGMDVVEKNWNAIDAGATAYVKVDVPAAWAEAEDQPDTTVLEGKPELVKMVKNILLPIDKMDGDSLPVSTFMDHVDGQFELGASAYEKRGVAVTVPEWDADKCIQCNSCAFVCPHATIRPFALTEEEHQRWREAVAKNPPLLHPVVRTHPVSGKQALFVNEGFTTRIVDVSEKESEALLSFLFAHITKPEFQVRWRWQPNDIAIWDNRVTQHYANADYLPQRRIMHRATILGDKPFYRAG